MLLNNKEWTYKKTLSLDVTMCCKMLGLSRKRICNKWVEPFISDCYSFSNLEEVRANTMYLLRRDNNKKIIRSSETLKLKFVYYRG